MDLQYVYGGKPKHHPYLGLQQLSTMNILGNV